MKLSWTVLLGNFILLIVFSMLFYFLKEGKWFFYELLEGDSFPGTQLKVWTLLIIVFSWIGLAFSALILFLNFRENYDFNKIINYSNILIAVVILFASLMIIISAIIFGVYKNAGFVIAVLSLISIFSIFSVLLIAFISVRELIFKKAKMKI